MTEKKQSGAGGKRIGAGSKFASKAGETKPKRIPLKYVGVVDELIKFLDDSAEISQLDKSPDPVSVKFKSATEIDQEIIFTVQPLKL